MKTRPIAVSFGPAMAAVIVLIILPVYPDSTGSPVTRATFLYVNGR